MRTIILALACFFATLGWVSRDARAGQCMLKRTGSADISIRNGRVLVPVILNRHRAMMVLNTMAASSVISSAYMEPLGLRQNHNFTVFSRAYGVDASAAKVTIPALMMVGSQGFRRPPLIAIADSHPPSADAVPVIGQLGMDLLGIEDFELDFANQKLNFYSTDHCPGVVVYWTNRYSSARISRGTFDPGPFGFPMELDGQKILAVLSTVTAETTLGTDVTRKLFGFDESSPGVETETDKAGHVMAHYRAMALTGSGITITNANIRLVPRPLVVAGSGAGCGLTTHGAGGVAHYDGCIEPAPLTIGLDVLRRLHLYFATRERVLYFSEASATK